jgi:tetratricopeptide (TPR) repeat protein
MRRFHLALLLLAGSAAAQLNAQCPGSIQRQIAERSFDEARKSVQALLARDPDDDTGVDCMGRLMLAQRKSREAVELFEKAVSLNPGNAQHHEGLGMALMDHAMTASIFRRPFIVRRLRTEFEMAVSLDPALVDARRGLVMFYSMAPRAMGGSMARAREHADAIMKLNPMRGHAALGVIAERQHDIAGAEKEFLRAITLNPDSSGAYAAAGAFYQRQKRVEDAIAMYQKVVVLDPLNEDVKKELASLNKERK